MGRPGVKQTVEYLLGEGIRAQWSHLHEPMPHLTAAAVAVNLQKWDEDSATYAATVCVPKAWGPPHCEQWGARVAGAWEHNGAQCVWGDCQFDEIMGVYYMIVLGRWEEPPPVVEEETSSEA